MNNECSIQKIQGLTWQVESFQQFFIRVEMICRICVKKCYRNKTFQHRYLHVRRRTQASYVVVMKISKMLLFFIKVRLAMDKADVTQF